MKTAGGLGVVLLAGMGFGLAAPAWGAYALSGAGPAAAAHGQAQAYLGVDLRDISDDQLPVLKLKDKAGAEIVMVDHDAPAGKAGLREHDVVLQMNGQAVGNREQARRMLHDCSPGKTVVLLISRDGQQMTVSARLSTQEEVERTAWQHIAVPEPQDAGSDPRASPAPAAAALPAAPMRAGNSFIGSILMNSSYTGAMLEQLNKQLAQFFGAPTGTGLLVRSVADNSPAAAAGLRVGDVIVKANEKNVASNGDWARAIKGAHGRPVSVMILRDKREQTLTLTPDGHHRSSLEELIGSPERVLLAHLNLAWLPHGEAELVR